MSVKEFFPPILQNTGYFNILVSMADNNLSNIESFIRLISTLTNADRTPQQFIKHLGDLVGFSYVDSYDEEVQRECIKNVWEQKKEIGTKKALTMMATYGDIDGYQGGDLFIPGTYQERPEAVVILPREYLFRWSLSTWSGEHKFAGPVVYKEGTILIEVSSLNDRIKDRVETVKPAGMTVVYKVANADGTFEYVTHTKVGGDL